jgi:uncharacterized protein YndB with AHSA1/START domain
MRQLIHVAIGFAIASALAVPCHAAVDSAAANGFSLSETVHVAAAPGSVYAAFVVPSHWWSAAHSYSHDAANFSLEARAGGCWCEKLPDGGSVEHLRVVMVMPGKAIRFAGAMGPFQPLGASGALTVTFKPAPDGGTDVLATYNLGGYSKDGFAAGAEAGDRVLTEQLARLKAFVETGSPETKEHGP